jgi:hypothetical protein
LSLDRDLSASRERATPEAVYEFDFCELVATPGDRTYAGTVKPQQPSELSDAGDDANVHLWWVGDASGQLNELVCGPPELPLHDDWRDIETALPWFNNEKLECLLVLAQRNENPDLGVSGRETDAEVGSRPAAAEHQDSGQQRGQSLHAN